MLAIISLIIVLIVSLLITRIASVALTLTGLSKQSARFQARSAFTGVGFTTNEAEKVVNHPVRRRILMLLMLLGNAGVVTAVSSLLLAFINSNQGIEWEWRIFWLVVGLLAIWLVASSRWVDQWLSTIISFAFKHWTNLDVRDYSDLLRLANDYRVTELNIEARDWLADKTLQEMKLSDEGVLVLGIHRANGSYIGVPRGNTHVKPDDTLIVYRRSSVLEDLDYRAADMSGEHAHRQSVEEQQRLLQEQKEQEETEQV